MTPKMVLELEHQVEEMAITTTMMVAAVEAAEVEVMAAAAVEAADVEVAAAMETVAVQALQAVAMAMVGVVKRVVITKVATMRALMT